MTTATTTASHEEERYARSLDLSLWKRLWRYTRPYRREVRLLAGAGLLTAAIDVAFPLLTRRVIDDVAARGADSPLVSYGLLYAAMAAVFAGCICLFIRMAGHIRTGISHDIRRDGFENLQRLSFRYFDERPVGWLMARMTSDCERLSNILAWGVLDLVWGLTLMSGITTAMIVLDVRLALAVVAIVPPLALVSRYFRTRILTSSRLVRRTNSRITAAYNEGIMGVRTAKVFAREPQNLVEFQELTAEMYRASVRNRLQSAVYLPLVLTMGSLATGLVLVIGGFDVTAGRLSVGSLIAFLTYARHFFEPVHELAHWFAEMQMAQASAERILGLVAEVPEIRDGDDLLPAEPARVGRIEFRNVSFGYGTAGKPVLRGFDLTVEPGQSVALVGETGAGKSTIVNLLCRFYEPTEGEIRFDGTEYRRWRLDWIHHRLGIVLQTPHLFSGTIGDNIRYGRLDATDDDVEAAARLAGAHDFIAATTNGYATSVGEGGLRLSTGQKQLVSFARAILARPEILVMDEATSSVDTETERRIQAALDRLLSGRTSFVIAHRLSTIRNADHILVIDSGQIHEQGRHADLMRLRGRYHAYYTRQALRRRAGARRPGAR